MLLTWSCLGQDALSMFKNLFYSLAITTLNFIVFIFLASPVKKKKLFLCLSHKLLLFLFSTNFIPALDFLLFFSYFIGKLCQLEGRIVGLWMDPQTSSVLAIVNAH
jgi:hypothetical protein